MSAVDQKHRPGQGRPVPPAIGGGIEFGEMAEAEIDAIPMDARLHVLDEGSPVRWLPITQTSRPCYPTGVARILAAVTR